jgi:hypothetical protein
LASISLLFLSHGPRGAQSDSPACTQANFPSSQSRGRQAQGFWRKKPNATKEKKEKKKQKYALEMHEAALVLGTPEWSLL